MWVNNENLSRKDTFNHGCVAPVPICRPQDHMQMIDLLHWSCTDHLVSQGAAPKWGQNRGHPCPHEFAGHMRPQFRPHHTVGPYPYWTCVWAHLLQGVDHLYATREKVRRCNCPGVGLCRSFWVMPGHTASINVSHRDRLSVQSSFWRLFVAGEEWFVS